jgi:hypothetical protein
MGSAPRQHISAGEHAGFLMLDEVIAAMRGNPGQPQCGLAVLRSTRHHLQKKPISRVVLAAAPRDDCDPPRSTLVGAV